MVLFGEHSGGAPQPAGADQTAGVAKRLEIEPGNRLHPLRLIPIDAENDPLAPARNVGVPNIQSHNANCDP